ncbi:MAG: hypothetical protein H8E17_02640 [Deltaproteobacteria bacterium]|nr:hypothetical protein [Deltaproteobacteria bacterium]
MFDLPNWFWNTLAIIVFIAVNIILWFHSRHCKAKGIKPAPHFSQFEKYKKHIIKWTDIYIISIILLVIIFDGFMFFNIANNSPTNIPVEYQQVFTQQTLSITFLILLYSSTLVSFMGSWLSPFHKNITPKKRLILAVLCCAPLVFGILFCVFENSRELGTSFRLLLGCLFPIVFINWSAILLGQSYNEFYSKLSDRIHSCLNKSNSL